MDCNDIKENNHIKAMIDAAKIAGKTLLEGLKDIKNLNINKKSDNPNDLVTEYDLRVEKIIIQKLKEEFPDYAILAEESGYNVNKNELYTWIIDPIDGTTSFTYGRPEFSISIALKKENRVIAGVVYDPCLDELFYAYEGRGAYLNGKPISVSIKSSLIYISLNNFKEVSCFNEFMLSAAKMTLIGGSAALELAYVAAGRTDVHIFINLKQWDMAAGIILVKEAGGVVFEPNGGDNYWNSGNIVAGNHSLVNDVITKFLPRKVINNIAFGK